MKTQETPADLTIDILTDERETMQLHVNDCNTAVNSFDYTYNSRDLIETETVTNGQIIDNFITGTTTEMPNILNQIMSKTAQGQTKTYVYDYDGNMTTGFTPEGYPITMMYDAQNRMTSAQYTDGSSVTHRNEYNYAGNSLLAELKKYDAGILTNTTKYLRSGFLPMQERDAANAVSREYTWGLNLGGGIGGLLNLRQGGADYSYLYDGKGNVSALIDSTQAVVAAYAYDPFGKLMSKSGTLDQPFTFSTKEYDSRTGLNNYGYRFYDSCSGKWSTRDPLGEEGGINLYGFVGNNPTDYYDPLGLFKQHPDPWQRWPVIKKPPLPKKCLKCNWGALAVCTIGDPNTGMKCSGCMITTAACAYRGTPIDQPACAECLANLLAGAPECVNQYCSEGIEDDRGNCN